MPILGGVSDLSTISQRFGADPNVVAAIRNASLKTGTQFETLLASAAMESGFRPDAQAATSTARGLYQFTEQTWLSAVRQYGAANGLGADAALIVQRGGRLTVEDPAAKQRILALRSNPEISSVMAAEHLQSLATQITAATGSAPDASELYLGHFLGGAGATKILQSLQATPSRPAADVLPEAAKANQSLFYAPDGTPYTTAQFVANMRDRVARAFSEVGSSMPSGPVPLTGSTTAGTSPDAPDSGASGWGVATPGKRNSTIAQSMAALLTEVFIRADNTTQQSQNANGRRNSTLPEAALSVLQDPIPAAS